MSKSSSSTPPRSCMLTEQANENKVQAQLDQMPCTAAISAARSANRCILLRAKAAYVETSVQLSSKNAALAIRKQCKLQLKGGAV
eukprot:13128-Heterococcus_DN1.PRE.1